MTSAGQHSTPGVTLLLLILVVAVVSTLGIFRGSRLRDMCGVLARRYLNESDRCEEG